MTKRSIAIALLLATVLAAGGLAYFHRRRAYLGDAPCAQQAPTQLSPYCLAQAEEQARRGAGPAMYVLAQHFAAREPAAAQRWLLGAARQGVPQAVGRVLGSCGPGQPFTVQDATAVLGSAPALDALLFRLGASCGPVDMDTVRQFQPQSLLAAPDTAGLCKVAVRYGMLRMLPGGAGLDGEGARQLLAACEARQPAGAALRKEAEAVRQMLAREIKPVSVSAD